MKTAKKLNAAGAATFIGQLAGRQISERTIRTWLAAGILPFHRVGPKLVIFDASELLAWYESSRGGPELPTPYASNSAQAADL
jgi:excisionase family DNA binding protein